MKIGTHNGCFHADEVLACVMLKELPEYRTADIVRTRDNALLKECDIVVDVGGLFDAKLHRYDHHQREFNLTFRDFFPQSNLDIKLSSAGLVYIHFGYRILSTILNKPVDSIMIKLLFIKVKFNEALELMKKEFLTIVDHYASTWFPAREIVLNAIKSRFDVHPSGKLMQISGCSCPWKDHLLEFEQNVGNNPEVPDLIPETILFCIYQRNDLSWSIQGVPPIQGDRFKNRLSLPESWRGLRDEKLDSVIGIPGCVFVHANGFLGIHKTYEGIMLMAKLALEYTEK